MNKSLKRLNSSIAAVVVVKNGRGYIKNQDINPIDELLFECDNVHLSQAGNEIFLNAIRAAVEQFETTGIFVNPKLY